MRQAKVRPSENILVGFVSMPQWTAAFPFNQSLCPQRLLGDRDGAGAGKGVGRCHCIRGSVLQITDKPEIILHFSLSLGIFTFILGLEPNGVITLCYMYPFSPLSKRSQLADYCLLLCFMPRAVLKVISALSSSCYLQHLPRMAWRHLFSFGNRRAGSKH